MNKLAIAQQVNILAGAQGSIDSTETATGYQATLVSLVDMAYRDIQTFRPDWAFMKKKVSIPLSDSVDSYLCSDCDSVTKVIYNQVKLREIPYEDWILTDHPMAQLPTQYTIEPGAYSDTIYPKIIFNPSNQAYILEMFYIRVPNVMSIGVDIPILPIQYHTIIVFKALIDLGSYLGNNGLISQYSTKYSIMLGEMMRSQVPQKTLITLPLV